MTNWQSLIEQFHHSDFRVALSITGGGSRVIPRLLSVPGGSNTVVEAVVPYSMNALTEYLGHQPDSFCSRQTALNMATVAWLRASHLAGDTKVQPMGVACTAALVSSRPKRGEHRCWVAVQTCQSSSVYSLVLAKGYRNRDEEEAVVGDLILQAILEVAKIADRLGPPQFRDDQPQIRDDETVIVESEIAAEEIANVVNLKQNVVWSLPDGSLTDSVDIPRGLLSGSFNPLHHGHKQLAAAAKNQLGGPVYFELPVRNADKPPLDFFAIEDRRGQFAHWPVALTNKPLFVQKSDLFPNTVFVIGMDTAVRILDPRFYGDDAESMRESLRRIYRNGCRFLVAARQSNGKLQTLAGLKSAAEFSDLFDEIPPEQFREDISSSEIRRQSNE